MVIGCHRVTMPLKWLIYISIALCTGNDGKRGVIAHKKMSLISKTSNFIIKDSNIIAHERLVATREIPPHSRVQSAVATSHIELHDKVSQTPFRVRIFSAKETFPQSQGYRKQQKCKNRRVSLHHYNGN